MAIRPKIDDVINKGGEVFADKQKEKDKWIFFNLRITSDLMQEIEDKLEQRIGMTKTSWILEAIQEKLLK